jgi:glycosyltransferase involved in cell wall biosynthesis
MLVCYAFPTSHWRQWLIFKTDGERRPVTSLSVIVITKDEAHNIQACLQSVLFADQLLVLDSGSTDETVERARGMGAEVSQSLDWPGFGIQKNRALALARCDWVLSIDADETLSPELQTEIASVLVNPQFDVYSVPRLSSYCGQDMRHSGWYPDRISRLFKRDAARFSDDLVHEKIITSRPVGQLHSHLLHESFTSFEAVLDKVNRYSTAGAQTLFMRGKRASLGKAVSHGLWAFFRTYVLRLGFLDGRMGLVLAISNAEGTYYRYLKLWLMSREKPEAKCA